MARLISHWENEDYWAKDVEAEKKARDRQYFWEGVRSLLWHIVKGVLQVGAFLGGFAAIILWFAWIVGDGEQIRLLRAATIIPVAGIVLGVFRWWDGY